MLTFVDDDESCLLGGERVVNEVASEGVSDSWVMMIEP
jgi:hypothetical protein